MRKTFLIAIGCLALAAAIWASNDPWKDKPYQQWDSKDLQRIFQDSPWAHSVHIEASWKGGGGSDDSSIPSESGAAAGGGHSMGGGASAGGGGNMGDVAGGGGGPMATFLVRWISSRTFREAMIRDRVLRGQMTDADAQTELAKPIDGYQIVVTGPDMTPFQKMDENALKTAGTLTLKRSKTRLTSTEARIQRTSDGSKIAGVLFVFPSKSENGEVSIPTDEKNADFSCTAGKFTLKWGFDVSKMTDSQGRDL